MIRPPAIGKPGAAARPMDVREHPFFSCFEAEDVRRLASTAGVCPRAAGDTVFREGDPSDSLYLVLEGSVRLVKRDPGGTDRPISTVRAGEQFGEFGALDGGPRSAGASCAEACVLARLSREDLLAAIRAAPGDTALRLMAGVIEKIRETDRRYVEERLREERQTALGQMARSIVHDLRNPLAVIDLGIATLETALPAPADRETCAVLHAQVRHLNLMAEDLLEFARGRSVLNRSRFPLGRLLERFREMNERYLATLGVRLALRGVEAEVDADEGKLLRVLQNLVSNAARAFDGRPGTIEVSAAREGDALVLRVHDDGPGIPEDLRASIFDPFAGGRKVKGFGLGNLIARSVVEAHGGTLAFETGTGRGTEFILRIPADP